MLAKYSIRAKIITVVAFLLLAMTGMGLLAVSSMRSINASTVDIATSWLPSVRVLGDLRSGVINYRNVIREHLLGETAEEKAETEKMLAAIVERNSKARQTYEPLITTPEERAIYNEWLTNWNNYKQRVQEVLELSRKERHDGQHERHRIRSYPGPGHRSQ
jgi:methyl-accepting chemotaxis protein